MLEFFRNPSIAAFVGALAAFLLVAATDVRRRYRKRRLLRCLVADNSDHAQKKRDAVRMNAALLKEDGKVMPAPFMGFPTQSIRDLQLQCLDVLTREQNQALDALMYWMNAIDDLLGEATKSATALKECAENDSDNDQRTRIAHRYLTQLDDAERNLGHLVDLMEHYVCGQPKKILEFQHPVEGADGS